MKNQTKIAVFFGGKATQHLGMIKKAAKKLGVDLELISYNRVFFQTEDEVIKARIRPLEMGGEIKEIGDFGVVFFRTTGKHWEEVDLIINSIDKLAAEKRPIVVDPLVRFGKPSYACKAWQMLKLKEAGIGVPRTVYGSLWFLFEFMKNQTTPSQHFMGSSQAATGLKFNFPIILKGSGGDRGTRVFKADSIEDLEKLVRDLRKSETEEGKRYMLQEYIENKGDYRVLVLGKKVLGVMKRSSQSQEEFRNNYSMGGKVEVSDLPENIKEMAVKAAEVCGLWVAGVDVMPAIVKSQKFKVENEELSENPKDYVILEVNKGPQFRGFMAATGIDVPTEMVKFLASLRGNRLLG
jgi:RimK family alpha-L-glutamate ligase